MKLLAPRSNINHYQHVMDLSKAICEKHTDASYTEKIVFHCYWKGTLNEKHLASIESCYLFHCVGKENREIILWLEDANFNYILETIIQNKYATVKVFDPQAEVTKSTLLSLFHNRVNIFRHIVSLYSDFVRYILLYSYGGIWFDLDVLFLKSLDPLLLEYGSTQMMVYEWSVENYPNGAIFIILEPHNEDLLEVIKYFISQNRGWGFQITKLHYHLPFKFLVLPCEWFDAGWVDNPLQNSFENMFCSTNVSWNMQNFFPDAFCYHWHNKWNTNIETSSIFAQLTEIIKKELETKQCSTDSLPEK